MILKITGILLIERAFCCWRPKESPNLASTFSDSWTFNQYTLATNRDSRCTMTESQHRVTVKRRIPFLQNKKYRAKVLSSTKNLSFASHETPTKCQCKWSERTFVSQHTFNCTVCLQIHKYLVRIKCTLKTIRNGVLSFMGKDKKYRVKTISGYSSQIPPNLSVAFIH